MGAVQGEGSPPSLERWARLVVDVPGPLSRGIWYRVLSDMAPGMQAGET